MTGKIGEFATLATGKVNLSTFLTQPANTWTETTTVQLDRPPEPTAEADAAKESGGSKIELKEKKRVKIEMQVRYKLIKVNHRRLTLVDDKNESAAARATTTEVNGEDYIVNSESSESEEISEAPSQGDDEDDEDDDAGDDDNDSDAKPKSLPATKLTADGAAASHQTPSATAMPSAASAASTDDIESLKAKLKQRVNIL